MKYCKVDGLRYPDKFTQCTACGAALYTLDAPRDFSTTSETIHATSCCPNPACRALVAPPGTSFCALCGRELKPFSVELWEQKCAVPALDENFVGVLMDPSVPLRQAAEMGLDREVVERRLEELFAERAGAGRSVLREWVREDVEPLAEEGANTVAAQARATSHAAGLKISRDYTKLILKELAPNPFVAPEPTVERPVPPPPPPAKPREAGRSESAKTPPAPPPKPATPRDAEREDPVWGASSAWPAGRGTGHADAEPAEPQPATREPRSRYKRAAGGKVLTPDEPGRKPAPEPRGGGVRLTSTETSTFQRMVLVLGVVVVVLALLGWVAIWRSNTRTSTSTNAYSAATPEPGSSAEPGSSPAAVQTPVPSPSVVAESENSNLDNSNDNSNAEDEDEQYGLLTASTDADGAMVWIDGRAYGVVSRGRPATFRVAVGDHRLRAAAPGREEFSRNISVNAGERHGVYMSMPPVETPPTPQEIAREHIDAARNFAQQRDYSAALEQIRQGLSADPGNQELFRLRQLVVAARDAANRPTSTPTPIIIERPRAVAPRPTATPAPPPPARADTYEPARVLRKVSPMYPGQARASGVTGTVVVEVTVDESGNGVSFRALSGHGLLRWASVDAAKKCKYAPARHNGQPVRGTVNISFEFSML